MVNNILSSLIIKKSHGNHKRTWQEVSNVLIFYSYQYYIVCANNK